VQAFRLKSPDVRGRFILHGLDPDCRYQFTDPYTGESFAVAGGPLSSAGRPFELPMMSLRVLLYNGR